MPYTPNKRYLVKFIDLKQEVAIVANTRAFAIEEAVKTLRDCGLIDRHQSILGRIVVSKVKPSDSQRAA